MYSKKSNGVDRKLVVLGVPHGLDYFAMLFACEWK